MKKAFLFLLLLIPTGVMGASQTPRILALTPHACEILYAIGAAEQVVGGVAYCDYPEAAKALPRVGSYSGINVEAALELKPSIAIVMNRNVKGVAMLEKMGVNIFASNPSNFETMFDDILKLGVLSQHQKQAEVLVDKLRVRLQKVRALPRSNKAVFYELWHAPLLTAGNTSFINDLIATAGGRNIFSDINLETPHVNVEAVMRAKPELIVIPLEKRNIEERQLFWQGWLGKDKVQFVAINPDLLHRPGPRLLDGLELLQQALSQVDKP